MSTQRQLAELVGIAIAIVSIGVLSTFVLHMAINAYTPVTFSEAAAQIVAVFLVTRVVAIAWRGHDVA